MIMISNRPEELNTKTSYIAYFDVLGYKQFFEDKENDIQELLKNNIAIANDTRYLTEDNSSILLDFQYKMFSDNCVIIIYLDNLNDKTVFNALVKIVAQLQLKILKDYKIPIRGAITKGQAYIDNEIVFGQGLIQAVYLESSVAIYPRIIIDKGAFESDETGIVKKDFDEQNYIDCFSLLNVSDIFFPEPDIKRDICKLRDSVYALVSRHGHYYNRLTDTNKIKIQEKIILKYLWLLLRYNEFVKDRKLPVSIEYKIDINTRFLRFELSNVKKNSWPVFGN